jgi:hypothetical protein
MIVNPIVLKAKKEVISKHDLLTAAVYKHCISTMPRTGARGIRGTTMQIKVFPLQTHWTGTNMCA